MIGASEPTNHGGAGRATPRAFDSDRRSPDPIPNDAAHWCRWIRSTVCRTAREPTDAETLPGRHLRPLRDHNTDAKDAR